MERILKKSAEESGVAAVESINEFAAQAVPAGHGVTGYAGACMIQGQIGGHVEPLSVNFQTKNIFMVVYMKHRVQFLSVIKRS